MSVLVFGVRREEPASGWVREEQTETLVWGWCVVDSWAWLQARARAREPGAGGPASPRARSLALRASLPPPGPSEIPSPQRRGRTRGVTRTAPVFEVPAAPTECADPSFHFRGLDVRRSPFRACGSIQNFTLARSNVLLLQRKSGGGVDRLGSAAGRGDSDPAFLRRRASCLRVRTVRTPSWECLPSRARTLESPWNDHHMTYTPSQNHIQHATQ